MNESGNKVIWNCKGYGPIFGKENDVYINDKCNNSNGGAVRDNTKSFNYKTMELCGQYPQSGSPWTSFFVQYNHNII